MWDGGGGDAILPREVEITIRVPQKGLHEMAQLDPVPVFSLMFLSSGDGSGSRSR